MAIRPNDEERSFGADRERQREVSNESARSARPSNGENVARDESAPESGSAPRGRSNRGFASMDRSKQREIASKGGRAAHQKGTAHEFDSGEARAAGRKGGVTVSRNREHMAAIGRRGGEARGANRAARLQGQTSSESNGSSPNASQNGSNRFQGDREVGLGSSSSSQQQRASAQPQRPSGNSLGGEPRGVSSDERNVERP
jgi:general stress protein YciG